MKIVLTFVASAALSVMALPAAAMNNPASAFCEKMGGRLEIVTTKAGALGLCYLADGRIIEEWTLFRMHEGKSPDEPRFLKKD